MNISTRTILLLLVVLPVTYLITIFNATIANSIAGLTLFVLTGWFIYQLGRSGRLKHPIAALFTGCVPITLVYTLSTILNGDYSLGSIKTIAQLWLVIASFAMVLASDTISWRSMRGILPILTVFVYLPVAAVHLYLAKVLGLDGPDSTWTRAKNTVAAAGFILAILNYLAWTHRQRGTSYLNRHFIAFALAVTCLLLSGSRGAQAAFLVFFACSAIWRFVWPKEILLVMVLVAAPTLIYIYLLLPGTAYGGSVAATVRDTTGANLYSGRQIIWPLILQAVSSSKSIWLGLGPSTTASQVMSSYGVNQTWSAHNLYLQVFLQGGIAGCVALVFLLHVVWTSVRRMCHSVRSDRAACCFLLAMLVFEMSEVTLLQNNLSTGLALWFTLALIARAGHNTELQPYADESYTNTRVKSGTGQFTPQSG